MNPIPFHTYEHEGIIMTNHQLAFFSVSCVLFQNTKKVIDKRLSSPI